ncbi:MAG: DUF4007 family protein [Desulfobacca sp.]|nr:DUF4007 family protein [Desulfobacca sp.]
MTRARKLQVSNGYYLNFNQLAQLLNSAQANPESGKNTTLQLSEDTGLPPRQVESLVSIGRALGIFQDLTLRPSRWGALFFTHDGFFQAKGTHEFLHYRAAGNYRNLVWYEVFNALLPNEPPMDYQGWLRYFRHNLDAEYSAYSLKSHLRKEVRFIIDAYLDKEFQRLDLLQQTGDGRLYRRRYLNPEPLVLAAMLYDYAGQQRTNTLQVGEMPHRPGAPPRLLGLDEAGFRQQILKLHAKDYLRYEGTHNLDQIRLKPDYQALSFLQAYYRGTEPQARTADAEMRKGSP